MSAGKQLTYFDVPMTSQVTKKVNSGCFEIVLTRAIEWRLNRFDPIIWWGRVNTGGGEIPPPPPQLMVSVKRASQCIDNGRLLRKWHGSAWDKTYRMSLSYHQLLAPYRIIPVGIPLLCYIAFNYITLTRRNWQILNFEGGVVRSKQF